MGSMGGAIGKSFFGMGVRPREDGAIPLSCRPMDAPKSLRTFVLGGEEVATMRDMLALFGTAFGDVETYTARQPDDAYLERLLRSDTFVAVTASLEGRVVGGLAGYILR